VVMHIIYPSKKGQTKHKYVATGLCEISFKRR
jgi:hypothetical protein